MASSIVTTNHDEIKRWTEKRGGKPSTVKGTEKGSQQAGLLRIDFPGYSGEDTLEEISWDDFFDKFEEKHLAFLYQDHTKDGKESRFFKIVSRDNISNQKWFATKNQRLNPNQRAKSSKTKWEWATMKFNVCAI